MRRAVSIATHNVVHITMPPSVILDEWLDGTADRAPCRRLLHRGYKVVRQSAPIRSQVVGDHVASSPENWSHVITGTHEAHMAQRVAELVGHPRRTSVSRSRMRMLDRC
jgi:hypothetical protein